MKEELKIPLEELERILDSEPDMENFIRQIEENSMVNAPHYLKDSIIGRSRQLDVQAAVKTRQLSKRLQLLCYSLRVGAAVAGALLFLVFSTSLMQNFPAMGAEREPVSMSRPDDMPSSGLYEKADKIADYIYQISHQIINMEVPTYDKKEK